MNIFLETPFIGVKISIEKMFEGEKTKDEKTKLF